MVATIPITTNYADVFFFYRLPHDARQVLIGRYLPHFSFRMQLDQEIEDLGYILSQESPPDIKAEGSLLARIRRAEYPSELYDPNPNKAEQKFQRYFDYLIDVWHRELTFQSPFEEE